MAPVGLSRAQYRLTLSISTAPSASTARRLRSTDSVRCRPERSRCPARLRRSCLDPRFDSRQPARRAATPAVDFRVRHRAHRAHYFDLDTRRWGRFSVNRRAASLTSPRVPIIGHDEERQAADLPRLWLPDLQNKTQVNKTWANRSHSTSGVFDNARRLWLMPRMQHQSTTRKQRARNAACDSVDGSRRGVELKMAGTVWPRGYAFHAGFSTALTFNWLLPLQSWARRAYQAESARDLQHPAPIVESPDQSMDSVARHDGRGRHRRRPQAQRQLQAVHVVPALKNIAIPQQVGVSPCIYYTPVGV